MNYLSDLNAPLLQLSNGDVFTLSDACRGVQVFGGTGSGKSSGSGRALAEAYLRANFGGLVMVAKPDETRRWQTYAMRTGREPSLLVVKPGGPLRLNFLDYILTKDGIEAANTAVDVLLRIAEASRLSKDRGGDGGSQFFEDATRQLLGNSIPVLYSAYGRMELSAFYRFITSAPMDAKQAEDPKWLSESFFFQTMSKAVQDPIHALPSHELGTIAGYWRFDFAQLDKETRSNILITVTSLLSRFLKGRLHDLFCTTTTFVPDMAFQGAVIVLDMPIKQYDAEGIIAAQLLKYLFQRAAEARDASAPNVRPVFLFADESQFFINSYDAEFLSTARSSKACTVFITQSLPTYYAKMGGANPEHYANMLLANFTTKIFHASGCRVTNQWAAESIGQQIVRRRSESMSRTSGENVGWNEGENAGTGHSGSGISSYDRQSYRFTSSTASSANSGKSRGKTGGESFSEQSGVSLSEQKDWKVPPETFAGGLRTGGDVHHRRTDAIWHQPDRQFQPTASNWLTVSFEQVGAP